MRRTVAWRTRAAAIGAAALLATAACAAAATRPVRSRYALANHCYAIRSAAGRAAPGRFFFKPTGLGTYMVADAAGKLVSADGSGGVTRGTVPGPAAEWAAVRARGVLALRSTQSGRYLTIGGHGAFASTEAARPGRSARLSFLRRTGCRPYPEAQLDARGKPFRGTRRDGGLFGWADAHLHIAADLRAGGRVIYGETYDRFGISEALGHDADVHGPDGSLDVTGQLLRGSPGGHDTHGWPTFTGWPTFDTYTHQQTYYRWLQRAWMSGMRLVVAQLVEDQPLCQIEPSRSHSCDEDATIALEAQRLQGLQRYVDAQSGGPGRGWLRLVYDPRQARRAIAHGKLAMLLGVEASDPFGCSERDGQPQCDRAAVDRGLALYQHLGIRAMFITHWIDNAFGGAALEDGSKGQFIGLFNVSETGNPFLTGPCPEDGQGVEMPPLPGRQCNTKGLTDLGRYLVQRLMDDHMLIEADHLSERARLDVLDMAEARHYPLVSSHNGTGGIWTPQDLRRLHALGGYVSATADVGATLATKIDDLGRYGFTGIGLGTDTGGFNALPGPAPDAATNPLRYPFRSYDGKVTFGRQRTGTRTFDLNRDGVAHYGLIPDLLADMQRRPGGAQAMGLLFRSAEAYLLTWEAAERA